jgi:predicted nucleic acid-binding protein
MMIVIDASVWVSRLVPQDIHYEASYRWLKGLEADGALLIAPILLLSEVAGAISRRTGETGLGRRAIDQLLRIPTLRIASIDRRLGQEAAILAAELSLRGADAAYIAVARRLNIPLVTWDREQQERGARVIAVRTPEP